MLPFWSLLLLAILSPTADSQPQWPPPPPPKPGPNPNPVDDGCDCYVVSGPDPGYFRHHRFYDFRHTAAPADTSNTGEDAIFRHDNPPSIHPTLHNTNFARDFAAQNWVREGSHLFPIKTVTSYKNVFRARAKSSGTPSHLILRTGRFPNYTSASEIISRKRNFHHCSLRVKLKLYSPPPYRPQAPGKYTVADIEALSNPFFDIQAFPPLIRPPAAGAVAGLFTYQSRWSESDIEILTKDPPTTIHYANQPDWDPVTDEEIPGSHDIVTIPKPWTSWSTHRLDWHPHISRWYLDGQVQNEKTYGVPTEPSLIAINLWSNGGVWSGDMAVGSAVHMGIEWIEVAYNTSHAQDPLVTKPGNARRARLDDGDEDEDGDGDKDDDYYTDDDYYEDDNYYGDDYYSEDDDHYGGHYDSEDDDYDDGYIDQNSIPDEGVLPDSASDGTYLRAFSHVRPRPRPITRIFASNFEEQEERPCKRVCRIDGVQRVGVPELITPQP